MHCALAQCSLCTVHFALAHWTWAQCNCSLCTGHCTLAHWAWALCSVHLLQRPFMKPESSFVGVIPSPTARFDFYAAVWKFNSIRSWYLSLCVCWISLMGKNNLYSLRGTRTAVRGCLLFPPHHLSSQLPLYSPPLTFCFPAFSLSWPEHLSGWQCYFNILDPEHYILTLAIYIRGKSSHLWLENPTPLTALSGHYSANYSIANRGNSQIFVSVNTQCLYRKILEKGMEKRRMREATLIVYI